MTEAISLNFLEPSDVRAWEVEGSSMPRVEIKDKAVLLAAQFRRAFPLSSPESYVCVLDGTRREFGVLKSLDGLDAETKRIIEQRLDRLYFAPEITRIDKLVQDAGMWLFAVQTQRGTKEFYVRNWRDSAHEVGPNTWQITAIDGQRYAIPSLDALDAHSQSLLDKVF